MSRRLDILKRLQSMLRGMTADGYAFPIGHDDEVSIDPTVNVLTGAPGSDKLFVLEPTSNGQKDYYPAEQLKEEFIVNIHARVTADGSDPNSRAEAWENLAADFEKAITADVTLGGLVCDARLLVPEPYVAVGSNIVVLLQPVRLTIYREYATGD